jgi:DNA-binding NtrC family response regulator
METTGNTLIFLVDDDTSFLRLMENYIHKFFKRITIKTFSTGEECLNNLHQKPDIILLDYLLNSDYPNAMNGIKVLSNIKKAEPETTVIMFSAQDHIDVAVDTMKHGAFDYIVKNDKIFLRVQNAIKNILYTFSLKKDKKQYQVKMWLFTVFLFILLSIIIYVSRHPV